MFIMFYITKLKLRRRCLHATRFSAWNSSKWSIDLNSPSCQSLRHRLLQMRFLFQGLFQVYWNKIKYQMSRNWGCTNLYDILCKWLLLDMQNGYVDLRTRFLRTNWAKHIFQQQPHAAPKCVSVILELTFNCTADSSKGIRTPTYEPPVRSFETCAFLKTLG